MDLYPVISVDKTTERETKIATKIEIIRYGKKTAHAQLTTFQAVHKYVSTTCPAFTKFLKLSSSKLQNFEVYA